MKYIIRLEEAAMFAVSLFGLYQLDADGWFYPVLFLGPDISMIGYIAGNAAGAMAYNFFHHKGVAVIIFLAGLYMQNELLLIIGIILFGHSSMDRMFGYGLKLERGFKYTHLGTIGKYKNKK
ncbi:MAG: DUF4260 domain-containing protein [Chitinophagaceae bacterium]|nr:DUF4260 domain-containing protein [Chitinophagaceae bacterium]